MDLSPGPQIPPDAGARAADLPKLRLPPDVRARAQRLTAHTWKRANDFNLSYWPSSLRFDPDWTYTAAYRYGECTNRGDWYASSDGDVATSTEAPCDKLQRLAGAGVGEWFNLELLSPDELLVNLELFVPEHKPLRRAVVRYFLGFRALAIRMEYDMPIRARRPTRFDFTFSNVGKLPLTLQRFGLTPSYHGYRRANRELDVPGDELAGKDLGGHEVAPGQSFSFPVEVTFPERGSRMVYFNMMVLGTQPFDTHQAHEVRIE